MRRTVVIGSALLCLVLLPAALSAQASVEQIIGLIQSGKCDQAIEKLDVELQLAPNWAYGHFLVGVCMQQRGLRDDALNRFQKARDLEPTLFVAWYQEALIRIEKQQYSQAVGVLDKGLPHAQGQEKSAGLVLKGQACSMLSDYDCVIESLKTTAGGDCNSNYYLGHAYYGKGQWKSSSNALKKAASACTGDTKMLANDLLSKALLNQGKAGYKEAQKAAKAALDAGGGSWKTYGEASLGAGDFREAEQAFKKVLANKPTDCNAVMNLGQAQLGAKKYGEAEKNLKKASACLKGDAQKNAYAQIGFCVVGATESKAKRYAGEVSTCDTDTRGRETVIKEYDRARGFFEKGGMNSKASEMSTLVSSLRDQIDTIGVNIKAREANEKTRKESLRAWAVQIDLNQVTDADRDGVPDGEDKCDGRPAPGEPVGLDGCPYDPPCG